MRITDFLQSHQLISRTMSQAKDVDDIVDDVLEVGLSLFKCDRIRLFYPCDPNAASFCVLAEKNSWKLLLKHYQGRKNKFVMLSPLLPFLA